jgi:hypothetical protein
MSEAANVTATVTANESIYTGFADAAAAAAASDMETLGNLNETVAPLQPAAPIVDAVADMGEPKDAVPDLDPRVAALLRDKPPTDWHAVFAFMAHVVPWPASSQDPGFVNLHYSMPNTTPGAKQALLKGMGWPYRSVDDLVRRAAWMNTVPDKFKDVWYCTSLQSASTTNNKGKPKAVRLAANALKLKAIWIDIDVKPGDPKHYATVADALNAILAFQSKAGLPVPSAIVYSGGGIHVYWISRDPLDAAVWVPYASGLKQLLLASAIKCDSGLTTDSARILRVPGTFNHKYNPPTAVTLAPLPLVMYDFKKLDFLKDFAPGGARPAAKTAHNIYAEGVTAAAFSKPAAAFAVLKGEPDLNAGINRYSDQLLSPFPIFRNCGFLRDALTTGGKDYDQTLWMYSVLCSTFMENGNAIAHVISKGHATYIAADTQALYDRKLTERHDRGLGYPQCSTIQGAGCKSCAQCPLLGKVKSPLNIRPLVTATVTNSGSPPGSSNWTGRSGVSFARIPHRKWLYGFDLVRGELTVIGSPGGAGKSSLAIGMAICVATNRELLGEKIRGGGDLNALVINGEDSTDEIRRRTQAFCLEHSIAERDLSRLTVAGADDAWVQRISLLQTNEKGMSALNQDGIHAIQLALDALHPDVIVIDPLVSFCAGGNMNDNAVMSSVMRKLKEIAARYECAVLIVHHTTKRGEAGNVETISGAAAITNLARRAIMPAPLTDDDLKRLVILRSTRFQHFKLVDAKSNLAPRGTDSPLYRLHSVELPNAEPPLYPYGDSVQAITRVVTPIQSAGTASAEDMKIEAALLELVDRGKEIDGQAYPYSPSLAGARNERALMPDALPAVTEATAPLHWAPGDLEAAIKTAIDKMLVDGRLIIEDVEVLMPKPGRFRRGRGLKAVSV